MPETIDIITIILIFVGLLLILIVPNIKWVKPNQVVVVERLGSFHRLLDKPGIYLLIPLVDRDIETVVTTVQKIERKLKIKESETTVTTIVSFQMQIFDVKTFVYSAIDSLDTVMTHLKEALEANQEIARIVEEIPQFATNYGFNITHLNFK
ncbi:MAG: SPFH domain-containing protein [Acholeplasmataceae bacterium]|nr:hypothetical protein [Acholeplasmataceae bacterium]